MPALIAMAATATVCEDEVEDGCLKRRKKRWGGVCVSVCLCDLCAGPSCHPCDWYMCITTVPYPFCYFCNYNYSIIIRNRGYSTLMQCCQTALYVLHAVMHVCP